MDLTWIAAIVAADVDCRLPTAEQQLRLQTPPPDKAWKYPPRSLASHSGRPIRPINDPAGLIRSLYSRTTCPAMRDGCSHKKHFYRNVE